MLHQDKMVVQLYFLIAIETIYKQHQKKKKEETNKQKQPSTHFTFISLVLQGTWVTRGQQ